ncbi:MAG: hypothetical protein RBT79_11530, partial [Chiayiivirga sp.]|nr:hypothetical protein [Chiayiivirga sp.]
MNHAAHDPASLELSPEQMRTMGQTVVERAVAHLAALDRAPSNGDFTDIEALCRALREDAPEDGAPLESLLDPLF